MLFVLSDADGRRMRRGKVRIDGGLVIFVDPNKDLLCSGGNGRVRIMMHYIPGPRREPPNQARVLVYKMIEGYGGIVFKEAREYGYIKDVVCRFFPDGFVSNDPCLKGISANFLKTLRGVGLVRPVASVSD